MVQKSVIRWRVELAVELLLTTKDARYADFLVRQQYGVSKNIDNTGWIIGRDTITILLDSKNWWAQAEGMNTLLLMSDRFPKDPMQYYQKFQQQ